MIAQTKAKQLNIEIKTFILNVIAIRKGLMRRERSYKNSSKIHKAIDFLERHIHGNNYNEKQISVFFYNNRAKILLLIPGLNSKSHNALLGRYNELLAKSVKKLNEKL